MSDVRQVIVGNLVDRLVVTLDFVRHRVGGGHIFVYVLEGALEIDVEGRELSRIEAGGAFHEIPDRPMTAKNVSATEGARFVVFQVGEQDKPLTVYQPQ